MLTLGHVLGLLCCVVYVSCKPNGAPTDSCFYMTPRHLHPHTYRRVYPSRSMGLYNITVSSHIYRPDRPIRVTLWGPPFKGFFMVAAENGAKDWPTGMFYSEDGSSKRLTCLARADTVTHHNNSYKDSVSVLWYGPESMMSEHIQFIATIVVNMTMYYTNIKSRFLTVDPVLSNPQGQAEGAVGVPMMDPWLTGKSGPKSKVFPPGSPGAMHGAAGNLLASLGAIAGGAGGSLGGAAGSSGGSQVPPAEGAGEAGAAEAGAAEAGAAEAGNTPSKPGGPNGWGNAGTGGSWGNAGSNWGNAGSGWGNAAGSSWGNTGSGNSWGNVGTTQSSWGYSATAYNPTGGAYGNNNWQQQQQQQHQQQQHQQRNIALEAPKEPALLWSPATGWSAWAQPHRLPPINRDTTTAAPVPTTRRYIHTTAKSSSGGSRSGSATAIDLLQVLLKKIGAM